MVGVGRFTSPDVMVRMIRQGVLDFIGCARPSIADPFLPKKIEEGRIEDIRECIGCNICITGDMTQSISRCTQNPTFMEEWRKGWHPERMNAKGDSANVLIVGAGPAGLEAALALSLRGYDVALAEARKQVGGRVARERLLPGLSAWGRVVDYRHHQISQRPNVETYLASWTRNMLEQRAIHIRLVEAGVRIVLNQGVIAIDADGVETNCSYTDARSRTGCDAVVVVASRLSNDSIHGALMAREAEWADAGIRSVKLIGDALPFRREITALALD